MAYYLVPTNTLDIFKNSHVREDARRILYKWITDAYHISNRIDTIMIREYMDRLFKSPIFGHGLREFMYSDSIYLSPFDGKGGDEENFIEQYFQDFLDSDYFTAVVEIVGDIHEFISRHIDEYKI